ncbi:hypothetical protein [Kingella negevensis]|uniref:hypothetical protein n=1 Tax=Kingella negevensis TaxID=1522312 RepID=UPI00050A2841|nr:hypothetical protein [Kingella negevensis]MDK4687995.1 hypothetical protein [Kingella negevensis]WII91021.1 hypothetical protein QEO93_11575 [Kingella negevensis]
MKHIILIATVFTLAACGSVGNTVLSDATLQEKTATTLRTTPANLVISNRTATADSITFNATVGKKLHRCFVKTTGVTASEAVCSGVRSQLQTN